MVNVECPGCSAPYSVSEKRIPASGLKMRCPKCGEAFMVEAPAAPSSAAPLSRKGGRTMMSVGAPAPPPTKAPIFARTPAPDHGPAEFDPLSVDNLLQAAERGAGADPAARDYDPSVDLDQPVSKSTLGGYGATKPEPEQGGGFGVIDIALPGAGGSQPRAQRHTAMGGSGLWSVGDEQVVAAPEMDFDLPMPAAGTEADLPMPAGGDDELGLPVPAPPKAGRAPSAGGPAPPRGAAGPAFGELDLPAPAPRAKQAPDSGLDLPLPADRGTRGGGFGGHADLPAPAPARPAAGLPAPARPAAGLPAPARPAAGLPAPARPGPPAAGVEKATLARGSVGQVEKATLVQHGSGLRPEARGSSGAAYDGEVPPPILSMDDLPAPLTSDPLADLPSPGGGLPLLAGGLGHHDSGFDGPGFDDLGFDDLPTVGSGGLPLPHPGGDLPLPGGGLPSPAYGAGLPLPGGGLPRPGGGLPLPVDDLPMAGGGLPASLEDQSVDKRTLSQHRVEELDDFDDDDLPAPPARAEADPDDGYSDRMTRPFGGGVRPPVPGSEAHLPSLDADPLEFDAELMSQGAVQPVAPPKKEGGAQGVGGEFDLDEAERSVTMDATALPAGLPQVPEVGEAEEGEEGEAPVVRLKKRRRRIRLIVATLPLLAIAGGLLTFTEAGPFGYYAISDAINESTYQQALQTFRQSVREQLGADTSSEAESVLSRALAEQARMPRYTAMTAYSCYLAFLSSVRFGRNIEAESGARQKLGTLKDKTGPFVRLARAAQQAVDKQYEPALANLEGLIALRPSDLDVLVLAAEVALKANDVKRAAELWKKAIEVQKDGRTLYGLARTQFAAGERDAAVKTAKEALAKSKNHAGARGLWAATLVWNHEQSKPTRDRKKEAEGLVLLEAITGKGPIRSAASSWELVDAYTLLGMVHLGHSKVSAAEAAFKAAEQIEPQATLALIGHGRLLYQSGRFAEALARFQSAKRSAPDDVYATVGIAMVKIAQERAKEAKDDLEALTKKNKHPLAGYWLGQAHLALGNRDQAEKTFQQAIKDGGDHPEVVLAYVALADLMIGAGKTDEANKVLAEASKKLPNSAELHIAKGTVALKAGRLDEAKREFTIASKLDDQNLGALFQLGKVHRELRDFGTAKAYYEKVQTLDPKYPGLVVEWGLYYDATNQNDKAIAMYEKALKEAPNDLDVMFRMGSTLVISERPEKATGLLLKVLAGGRQNSPEVNHFLGRAYLLQDQPSQALGYLKTAAKTEPTNATYQLYLGWAANDAGQYGEAKTAITLALELDKGLADAYWQRGVLEQRQGDTNAALDDLKKALEMRPSRYQAYATMAICYQALTKYDEAVAAWRKAIEGRDDVPEWRYRLGQILWSRNNKDEAAKHLLAAVDLIDKLLAEKKLKSSPRWLAHANFILGEALHDQDKERALKAYKAYLRDAPPDDAYRDDAKKAIIDLGERP